MVGAQETFSVRLNNRSYQSTYVIVYDHTCRTVVVPGAHNGPGHNGNYGMPDSGRQGGGDDLRPPRPERDLSRLGQGRVSPRRSHHHKPFFVHITGTGKSTPDMAQSGIFGVGGNELQWKVLAEEGAWRRGSPIHKNLLLVSEIGTALEQPRDFSSWCLSGNPKIDGTER